MTVISDAELHRMAGDLFPHHAETMDLEQQIQPASVDLRLGSTFWRYRDVLNPGMHQIDPLRDDVTKHMEKVEITEGDRYLLRPGHEHFVLATTYEAVCLPDDLVARVEGRSSLGRLGLRVHSTAGYIDPGFYGKVTLEIDAVGRYPIWLTPGMRVCQLSFSRMAVAAERPYGSAERNSKYHGQMSTQPSLAYQDREGN